jgi:F0F1-type ATP synthase assembly protein I
MSDIKDRDGDTHAPETDAKETDVNETDPSGAAARETPESEITATEATLAESAPEEGTDEPEKRVVHVPKEEPRTRQLLARIVIGVILGALLTIVGEQYLQSQVVQYIGLAIVLTGAVSYFVVRRRARQRGRTPAAPTAHAPQDEGGADADRRDAG